VLHDLPSVVAAILDEDAVVVAGFRLVTDPYRTLLFSGSGQGRAVPFFR
jgi:hypothetical protein